MFFDRPDYDLASAVRFAIEPAPKMIDALARAPSFDDILASARQIEQVLNTRD